MVRNLLATSVFHSVCSGLVVVDVVEVRSRHGEDRSRQHSFFPAVDLSNVFITSRHALKLDVSQTAGPNLNTEVWRYVKFPA